VERETAWLPAVSVWAERHAFREAPRQARHWPGWRLALQSTQLRFQEIDFALKASDVLALRTGCVLVAEPDHKDSNRKNNDEKEFHTQN
jgi:hypothetical protein